MKSYILSFLLVVELCGCGTLHYTKGDLIGVFSQLEEDGSESKIDLILNERSFSLVDAANYKKIHNEYGKPFCCDTITYGTWFVDSKHGIVTLSTSQLSDNYIADTVEEKQNQHSDSLYFNITNPIEKEDTGHHYIYYTFELYSSESELGNSLVYKPYYNNRIVIYNPDRTAVQQFSIHIYVQPEYFESARNVAINSVKTFTYKVKERGSNFFYINIPTLTYQYLTYLRLHDHIIKLINKNEIIWDGVKYLRKKS